jgi:hypothetical protein
LRRGVEARAANTLSSFMAVSGELISSLAN